MLEGANVNRRTFLSALTATASGLLVPEPVKVYSFIWAPPSPYEKWLSACRLAFGSGMAYEPRVDTGGYHSDVFAVRVGMMWCAVGSQGLENASAEEIGRQLRESYDRNIAIQLGRIFPS